MKKMNYTKPLAEVMDFSAEDILRTSGEYDATTITAYKASGSAGTGDVTLSGSDLVIR